MLLVDSLLFLTKMTAFFQLLKQCLTAPTPTQAVPGDPPPCGLGRLPEELLLRIFTLLDPPIEAYTSASQQTRSKDLSCVCRVNKQFRRIVTPLLYMSVERGIRSINISKLLLTLIREPTLNQHLKRIRQRPLVDCDYSTLRFSRLAEEAKIGFRGTPIILSAGNLQMPDPQGLVTRWHCRDDVLLALCVFGAPNLECLWVNPAIPKGGLQLDSILLEGICRSALGRPFGNVHRFVHLRVLHLDLSAYNYFPTSNALPLLLLPKLEDLTLGGWGKMPGRDQEGTEYFPFGQRWTWPCRKSPIKKLSLLYPWVDPGTASKMILACESLVRFECTNHRTPQGGRRGWYSLISAAILEHASTLEELSIGERSSELADFQTHGRIWCAPRLINLRYLRAPYHVLAGHASIRDFRDMIPTSLRHLIVSLPKNLISEEDSPRMRISCGDRRFPELALIELHQRSTERYTTHVWSYNCVWFFTKFKKLFAIKDSVDLNSMYPKIILDMRHVRACHSRFPWCFANDSRECCGALVHHSRSRTLENNYLYITGISTSPIRRNDEKMADDDARGY